MSELPEGLEPITPGLVERRRLELELEPHRVAWQRIERAIASTDGSAADRAAVAAEVRSALGLVDELEVRGTLAREAERLACEQGIKLRASEMLRAITAAERERKTGEGRKRELQGRPVVLRDPEPWPEPVDGAKLLDELARTLRRFLALPEGAATAIALWALHSHAHDAASVSPILAITSPEKRCGKTTLLHVLGALVPRPLTAANLTAAALFRAVESFRPSLLLDEADSFLTGREAREELRGVLNSGHARASAIVIRTAGDDYETRAFSTWCAKAIALIGTLPPTLEDRSIVVPMRRRAPEEEIEKLRLDRLDELEPLRRMAWRWAQDNLKTLRAGDPDVPEGLNDRAADNWRPLLTIAEAAGGSWPEGARRAAVILAGAVDEGEASAGVQLLADLRDLFADRGTGRLPSAEIVEWLVKQEDRPWPEWGRQRKPLTKTGLARLLRPFGVKPKGIRLGESTPRGYLLKDLDDAFRRWLPPAELQHPQHPSGGAENSETGECNTRAYVAPRESGETPRGAYDVAPVAVGEGGAGVPKGVLGPDEPPGDANQMLLWERESE